MQNKVKGVGGKITLGGVEGESRYACFFYVFRDGGSISWGGTEKLMFGFGLDFLKPKQNMNFSVPPISCHKMKTGNGSRNEHCGLFLLCLHSSPNEKKK